MSDFLDMRWSHWFFVGALLVSLTLVFRLSKRLESAHREVWEALNRQEHPVSQTHILFRSLLFAFGGTYRDLRDAGLSALVWAVRIAIVATAAALALTAKG